MSSPTGGSRCCPSGGNVYLDTRLILQKLEALYPPSAAHPALSAGTGEHAAIERLLSKHATDGGLFMSGMRLIPADAAVLRDPRFVRDRADYAAGPSPVSPEALALARPGALADGRNWVLETTSSGPMLADIEAIWVLHWVVRMPGALPADVVGPRQFPKVFAWIERFRRAVELARKAEVVGEEEENQRKSLTGEEVAGIILGAPFAEEELEREVGVGAGAGAGDAVDEQDPVAVAEGLKRGANVRLWPTDSGSLHKDSGTLVAFNKSEVVIETRGRDGDGEVLVRLHAPRHGFRVRRAVVVTRRWRIEAVVSLATHGSLVGSTSGG